MTKNIILMKISPSPPPEDWKEKLCPGCSHKLKYHKWKSTGNWYEEDIGSGKTDELIHPDSHQFAFEYGMWENPKGSEQ